MSAMLVSTLRSCAVDVFHTMVSRTLTEADAAVPVPAPSALNIVGTVGFTGASSCLVVFATSFEAARDITAGLLDLDSGDAPSHADVVDAIGEVTNMIAGSFRTRLAIEGESWAISVPTVTFGSDFHITPMTTGQRTPLHFQLAGEQTVLVELILNPQVAH